MFTMSVPALGAVEIVPVVVVSKVAVTAKGVTPPMTKLFNVPALVGAISTEPLPDGFMWTWPVPVGLMSI